ncbi:MAG: UDP-N-acetylmuramate dehydrogenase [Anaerolineae bacterium]|nr:UDP-N-acetylmuramate dehydrogenase [Anaerolineae bacterium]
MLTELRNAGLSIGQDVPLSAYTTFRIGGPADLLLVARTVDELVQAVRIAQQHGLPWWVLGGGSNVLISDAGVRGLTIVNRCARFEITERRVWAASGMPLARLAREMIQRGMAGLEWAVSVPGTVGGAVVGNAGAHGSCIADRLRSVELLDLSGDRVIYPATDLGLDYRDSRLKSGMLPGIVLRAEFELTPGQAKSLSARAEAYLAHRRRTQPTEASAGSIFRNPPGDYAGRLIEAAGLKGVREGDAQVSPQHANFIINRGHATAADVARLIRRVQQDVEERFGVRLELEILFVGEWQEVMVES